MTVLRSGSASDVGRVRTVNEDHALETMTLFAVADGMGGHAGGEVASRTAIEALQQEFRRQPSMDGLAAAVRQANTSVWERSLEDAELRGMGTTLTAAALVATDEGDRLALANVGDSRSYVLRDGELTQMSHDHSVAEELVDRGELSEAEAAIHPHRHILTRALGVSSDVDVDVWEMTPTAGDRYLLCSDGLTNEVPETRIAKILTTTTDPQEAADTLVRLANENGGNDNITVVVLDVLVGDEEPADGAPPAAVPVGAPQPAGQVPGAARRTVASVATAPERPETSTLLGRAGTDNDAAAGMRAMHARAAEVSDRLRSRRITFRVFLFVLVLAAIVAGAYIAVRWWVDSSYYVKLTGGSQGQVEIFRGRQGGFLGIQPKVVERSGIVASQIPSYDLGSLRAGIEESSLEAAQGYVTALRTAPGFGSASTTTTTTAPAPTTTGGG